MREIEYYFDCSSPWTYLSFKGILELSNRYEFDIIWKPILVGGVFNSNNPSVYESRKNPVKEKSIYSQKDLSDWAKIRGIEINWPKIFPVNSVKAMRGSFYALQESQIEEYVELVFNSYWSKGKDISSIEVLLDLIKNLNWDANSFIRYIEEQSTKKMLMDNTQELIDRGGFGSPTFFVNKEDIFFGNDRLYLIEELHLKG